MNKLMIAIAVCILALLPATAYAYLDPGTGSYMLQMLIAGAVGLAMGIKVFWKTLVYKISKLFNKE